MEKKIKAGDEKYDIERMTVKTLEAYLLSLNAELETLDQEFKKAVASTQSAERIKYEKMELIEKLNDQVKRKNEENAIVAQKCNELVKQLKSKCDENTKLTMTKDELHNECSLLRKKLWAEKIVTTKKSYGESRNRSWGKLPNDEAVKEAKTKREEERRKSKYKSEGHNRR